MTAHTFRFNGPTEYMLEQPLGPTIAEAGPATPVMYSVVDLGDGSLLTDLIAEMAKAGWTYVGQESRSVPSLLQAHRSKLTADASAINAAAGWADVLSVEVDSGGSSALEILGSLQAGVTLGGQLRVVIDGGSFSDAIIAMQDLQALAGNAPGHLSTYVDLPSGDETYAVKLQASAAALGSVTPRAGSSLIVKEYSP